MRESIQIINRTFNILGPENARDNTSQYIA